MPAQDHGPPHNPRMLSGYAGAREERIKEGLLR